MLVTDKGTDLESIGSNDTYGLQWELKQVCGGF